MRVRNFVLLLAACVSCAASALGQTGDSLTSHRAHALSPELCEKEYEPLPGRGPDTLMQYELLRLPPDSIGRLRSYLATHCWEHALRLYFLGSRAEHLADWVVYIDARGDVHQAMTRGRRLQREFRDQKYVWVIAFLDPGPVAGEPANGRLRFSRRSVNYRRDPVLTGIARAIAGRVLPSVDPAPAHEGIQDSTQTIVLRQLSMTPALERMYVAQGRFGLAENAVVELALEADSGRNLTDRVGSVYTNVENHGRSRWDVGIAAGGWFGRRSEVEEDTLVTTGSELQPNLYLVGYLNFPIPPRLPSHPESLGPAVGVNVGRGRLLDELFVALAVGRILGSDVGLLVGANWTKLATLESAEGELPVRRERRKSRLLLAIDLRL